tara:strand:- start:3633 stop:3755 length:123 start_codon:yes stop_codon:yes gene_type:complete
VQQLDGDHHRQRKAMFLQINHPDRVDDLADAVTPEWHSER